jgi:HPt (histidine-containing phosphotransfer) domain-containing protein
VAVGIPGVDEQSLLDLFEGNMALYKTVLGFFIEKAPAALDRLRNVSQDTLSDYTNNIHGLKGACANICAEEARKKALELEMTAKAGDLAGVLAGNEPFLKYMEELLAGLQNWINDSSAL